MLSNIEIYWLIKEMKSLEGGWFQKFWKTRAGYKMRIRREGPVDIIINPPEYAYITKYRVETVEPDSFTMKIRKELERKRLLEIKQPNFDRIIEFSFSDGYKLVVEMFSKGNVILVHNGSTVIARRYETWSDRVIKPGREYNYPKSTGLDPTKMTLDQFKSIFVEKDVIRSLVKGVKFGNRYLERACELAGERKDKNKPDDPEKLFNTIKEMTKSYNPGINDTPDVIKMSNKFTSYNTFNEALDQFYTNKEEKTENVKEAKLKRILKEQLEARERLELEEKEYKRLGDVIYSNYQRINEIINKIKELRKKGVDWRDIEKELGIRINEKKGTLVIDLE